MKKSTIFLISISCFILALISFYGIRYYAQQKAKQEFVSYLNNNQYYFSPTEVVRQFIQLASQGKEETNLFTTEIPISYWIDCKEEELSEKYLDWIKTSTKKNDFLDTFISWTKPSVSNLGQIRFKNEQIYTNEATVEFDYISRFSEPVPHRALLIKSSRGWKVFDIELVELGEKFDWMKNDSYAKPRPNCSTEKIESLKKWGSGDGVVEIPN